MLPVDEELDLKARMQRLQPATVLYLLFSVLYLYPLSPSLYINLIADL